MDERLDRIEIKVAFLEKTNAELSDEIFRQRVELDALREKLAVLAGRFEAAQSQPTPYTAEDEKPPHY